MIKFFRTIRLRLLTQAPSDKVRASLLKPNGEGTQRMLQENRFSRYLIHAIADIHFDTPSVAFVASYPHRSFLVLSCGVVYRLFCSPVRDIIRVATNSPQRILVPLGTTP